MRVNLVNRRNEGDGEDLERNVPAETLERLLCTNREESQKIIKLLKRLLEKTDEGFVESDKHLSVLTDIRDSLAKNNELLEERNAADRRNPS